MRQIRLHKGVHLEDGLHPSNFKAIAQILKDLDYSGPVAAATDKTVCVKSMQHYNRFLVGAQGGDIVFTDGDDLTCKVKSIVK